VLGQRLGGSGAAGVRLVKGTHIAVPRLYDGDHAYILQAADGRVVFALPYGELSLVGTTDNPVERPEDAQPSGAEIEYLCATVNAYFERQTAPDDVRWAFAGIRALYDDGAAKAKDVTRDYRLELEERDGAKLLSVFGGKITTARALAEEVMEKLGVGGAAWTRDAMLPGVDRAPDTSGRHFGGGLHEGEVRYLIAHEFARTADDVLWRRTKLGLVLNADEQADLAAFMSGMTGQQSAL